MVTFAEEVVLGSDEALASSRRRLVEEMSAEAMVDAAAVASNFQRMVRIADSTGIPLGGGLDTFSKEVQKELGLERFQSH